MPSVVRYFRNILKYREPEAEGLLNPLNEQNTDDTGGGSVSEASENNKRYKKPSNCKTPPSYRIIKRNKSRSHSTGSDVIKESNSTENIVDLSISTNLERVKKQFNMEENMDIVIRKFILSDNVESFIVYIDGLSDKSFIKEFLLNLRMEIRQLNNSRHNNVIDYIAGNIISTSKINKFTDFKNDIIPHVFKGYTALFIDGCSECLVIEGIYNESRMTSPELKDHNPEEGNVFNGNLISSISKLRTIIRNPELIIESMPIGNMNKTDCCIIYLKGTAASWVVNKVRYKIKCIDWDFYPCGNIIEKALSETSFALFPSVIKTDLPLKASSLIMEARVVIMIDGLSTAIAVPATLFHLLHAREDSFFSSIYSPLLFMVKNIGIIAAVLIPGIYISLLNLHQDMIPVSLLSEIANARKHMLLPTIMELCVIELIFIACRESNIRFKRITGAVSGILIVLIIGLTAMISNLVSSLSVIVASSNWFLDFAASDRSLNLSLSIIRYIFLLLAIVGGFYGIALGMFIIGGMMCSLKSYGIPFLFSSVSSRHLNKKFKKSSD